MIESKHDPMISPLRLKGVAAPHPMREGLYVTADTNNRSVTRVRSTLMGNLISTGPYNGKNVREVPHLLWYGPFANQRSAEMLASHLDAVIAQQKGDLPPARSPEQPTASDEQQTSAMDAIGNTHWVTDILGDCDQDDIDAIRAFCGRNSPKAPRKVLQKILDALDNGQ